MAAICGIPGAERTALFRKDPPGSRRHRERTSSCIGQEDARGVHQVDQRELVLAGDVLGAEDLLDGHRKTRARLHGGVVGDDHDQPVRDPSDDRKHARGRSTSPLFVELKARPETKLEGRGTRIDERGDPLARGHPTLVVLPLDRVGTSPLMEDLRLGEHATRGLAEVWLAFAG